MKKFLFIAAMASVALVSCVKNEVIPVNEEVQEITYLTSPVTKADPPVFDDGNVFESWAFYTPTNWETNQTTAVPYGNLADVLISHDGTNWWNNKKVDDSPGEHFYWPRAGKLTFFSYSLNSASTNDAVNCSREKGIYVEGYNVNTNLNDDFLVANIAKDLGAIVDGANVTYPKVSTVFHHKLSNVAFTIETTANYTGLKVFKLQSITLLNLAAEADYQQLAPEGWTNYAADVDETVFYNTPDLVFDHSGKTPTAVQSLYMPQTWGGNEQVQIVYTVTSGDAVENVTITKDLDEIFTAGWEMGKKYTCAIKIGLSEILWDPSVTDWTSGTAADFEIN